VGTIPVASAMRKAFGAYPWMEPASSLHIAALHPANVGPKWFGRRARDMPRGLAASRRSGYTKNPMVRMLCFLVEKTPASAKFG